MDDFLAKPVDLPTLAAMLNQQARPLEPAPAPPPPLPASGFDEGVLQQLRSHLPPAKVPPLYQSFIRDVPASRQRLSQAMAVTDAGALRAEAHALKGASASLGLIEVAAAALALEQHARSGADARTLQQVAQDLLAALLRSEHHCAARGLL